MALDAYSLCPCGSGKKFKWCCQPIHVEIDKAFQQDQEGQHDAALRLMDGVVQQNPANPEAYGRKAQLLYQNEKLEDAESTLQKAFEINPDYPFGYLLRGIFRQHEGEFGGAQLLFRKAAAYYDPEARDVLAQVYGLIAECELKLNRPVAARAALKMALHCRPNEDLSKTFDSLFGPQSHLPESARREYTFLSTTDADKRKSWDCALAAVGTGKLTDSLQAFQEVTTQHQDDAAAWYNLGLTRAWLGENRDSIEALDRYVELEQDEPKAAAAWALAEVLRCGEGMEELANYIEHSVTFQMRDPRAVVNQLQTWEKERRLVGVQTNEEQSFLTALLLERLPQLSGALAAIQAPGIGAYVLLVADRLRLWHTNLTRLEQIREEIQERLGPALAGPHSEQAAAKFNEILAEALSFPLHIADKEEAQRRVRQNFERYLEETWIHRPLRSLNQIPPIDAAGHRNLRKKLLGAVQFLEDCAMPGAPETYDFNRLRHKLGLSGQAVGGDAKAPGDISALSVADLSALVVENLSDAELEQGYQASLKLDARELAGRFAAALVNRPVQQGHADRYPLYSYLIRQALENHDSQAALDLINEGEKTDCEANEGRRRNDYELRRAQVHAQRGESTVAKDTFDRLIERLPSELRYRSSAAEAMLSANQADLALNFAEQGLAKAREKNDRESEEHFKELVAAASRQTKR